MSSTHHQEVRWARLRPDQLKERINEKPIAYLPFGLCEPHGHIAPFGLDTIKADYYCDRVAERFGGVVAPTQAYHIHETGFHKPWLDEVVGEHQPYLGSMPAQPMCYHLLFQLRAFLNAGFKAVIGVSGHSGGSQKDLRRVAIEFSKVTNMPVLIQSDPEWVQGQYQGDHAGKYEISQLLAIEPDLIDLSLLGRASQPNSGGQLALGEDASEASAQLGKQINELIIHNIISDANQLNLNNEMPSSLSIQQTQEIWEHIQSSYPSWHSD